MKTNKIKSIALICSTIIIASSIFSCANNKQAESTNSAYEVNKNQQEFKKSINRELSDEQWIEDIDYLANELPKRHKNLFFNITQDDFEKQIEGLKKEIPHLNDDEIKLGLLKIVASVGDAHTHADFRYKKKFPLEFYWFEKNIYVTNTSKDYENILYSELVSINGEKIDEVIEEVTKIISHDNLQWVKSFLPIYLSLPEILYGLNILENTESAVFTFKDLEGNLVNIDINSRTYDENTEWIINENENIPLYRKNSDQNYWYEYLDDSKTLYFKYNSCREMEDKPIDEFRVELFDALIKNEADKFVIDLRNNRGGNHGYFTEFIDRIYLVDDQINEADKLFVIIGRDTFSSGVSGAVYAKENTNATLVGEGTGGMPNSYGGIVYFILKNSNLGIIYSTAYYKFSDEDITSLTPDINVEVTLKDYMENRDPVLERILSNSK